MYTYTEWLPYDGQLVSSELQWGDVALLLRVGYYNVRTIESVGGPGAGDTLCCWQHLGHYSACLRVSWVPYSYLLPSSPYIFFPMLFSYRTHTLTYTRCNCHMVTFTEFVLGHVVPWEVQSWSFQNLRLLRVRLFPPLFPEAPNHNLVQTSAASDRLWHFKRVVCHHVRRWFAAFGIRVNHLIYGKWTFGLDVLVVRFESSETLT